MSSSSLAASATVGRYYNYLSEEYAIYFTVPVAVMVIFMTTCFYGFRLNILDYTLSFLQDIYAAIFIKNTRLDAGANKPLPIASLKFDYRKKTSCGRDW